VVTLDILKACKEYEKGVTLREPRERATAFHAHDSCRCCGACVMHGKTVFALSQGHPEERDCSEPAGMGPARNIVAFTGGDLTCCPEFYIECTKRIKAETDLWC